MKALTLVVVSSLFSMTSALGLSDYYPAEFKDRINGLQNKELKQEIFKVLDMKHVERGGEDVLVSHCDQSKGYCYGQKILGYRAARKILFGKLHLKKDDQGHYYIRDVYCHKNFFHGVGPNLIPDHTKLNCEHTWPQSKFNSRFPKEMQRSDLHHLFPTDSQANGIRGNFEFGEVDNQNSQLCNSSEIGPDHGGFLFEPPADHRGNVARSLFYFSIRYKIEISSTQEATLRKWHKEDPVDFEEQKRNNQIHKIQGNRNPFIDMPEIANQINDF